MQWLEACWLGVMNDLLSTCCYDCLRLFCTSNIASIIIAGVIVAVIYAAFMNRMKRTLKGPQH